MRAFTGQITLFSGTAWGKGFTFSPLFQKDQSDRL